MVRKPEVKILIVEDNKDSRMLLRKALEHEGYAIEEAYNGVEALRQAGISPPDMIISDLLMPEMDGFRLCMEIKRDPGLQKIPVIFYTGAYIDPQDEKLAASLGVSRFILKPVELDELMKIITEVFLESRVEKLPAQAAPEGEALFRMYEKSMLRVFDQKVNELQLYMEIFTNSNDAIAIIDTQGAYVQYNAAYKNLIGYTDEELKGKTPAVHLGEEVILDILRIISAAKTYRDELISSTKSGKTIYIDLSAFSVENEKGEVIYYVGIIRDITIRKQTEIAIQKQMKDLNIINSVIKDVSSSLELENVLFKITRSAAELVGGNGASIAFYNEEGQFVTYPYHFNLPDKCKEIITGKEQGLAGQIIETGRSAIIDNYPVYSGALKEFIAAGCKVLIGVPLITRGKTTGVLMVFSMYEEKHFTEHDMDLLEGIGQEAAIAIENATLYKDLEQMLISTITTLASMIDAKSPWTRGHSERVTRYAVEIGRAMGLNEHDIQTLKISGLFHDIGKIGTYDVVLNKPDDLTPEEFEIIKQHPRRGAVILEPIVQLKDVVPIVMYHHEKWDGTGYPEGLRGDRIPLLARILCVADAYDSIVSDRPYRKSPEKDYAISELQRGAGTQFDPAVVSAFLEILNKKNSLL